MISKAQSAFGRKQPQLNSNAFIRTWSFVLTPNLFQLNPLFASNARLIDLLISATLFWFLGILGWKYLHVAFYLKHYQTGLVILAKFKSTFSVIHWFLEWIIHGSHRPSMKHIDSTANNWVETIRTWTDPKRLLSTKGMTRNHETFYSDEY